MTEEIIIDSVDVSEWTDEEIRYYFEKHSPKAIRQIAFDLYKQLKRKEQECEELKKELDKYLNQEEEEIRQLNNDNKLDEILSAISKANTQIEKESNYKQALDKIEEFCTVYSANHDAYETVYKNILAFINEAKEQ